MRLYRNSDTAYFFAAFVFTHYLPCTRALALSTVFADKHMFTDTLRSRVNRRLRHILLGFLSLLIDAITFIL